MFRVRELATGTHPVRAKDVHIAKNKSKLLFILYDSKTDGKNMRPQKVKISAVSNFRGTNHSYFCPFRASREYLSIRGNYTADTDPFFVFSDNSPVAPEQVRLVLHKTRSY